MCFLMQNIKTNLHGRHNIIIVVWKMPQRVCLSKMCLQNFQRILISQNRSKVIWEYWYYRWLVRYCIWFVIVRHKQLWRLRYHLECKICNEHECTICMNIGNTRCSSPERYIFILMYRDDIREMWVHSPSCVTQALKCGMVYIFTYSVLLQI